MVEFFKVCSKIHNMSKGKRRGRRESRTVTGKLGESWLNRVTEIGLESTIK